MKSLMMSLLCLSIFSVQSFAGVQSLEIRTLVAEDRLDRIEVIQAELNQLNNERKQLEADLSEALSEARELNGGKKFRKVTGGMIVVGIGVGLIEVFTAKASQGAFMGLGIVISGGGILMGAANEINMLTLSAEDAKKLLAASQELDAEIEAKKVELKTEIRKHCQLASNHELCSK